MNDLLDTLVSVVFRVAAWLRGLDWPGDSAFERQANNRTRGCCLAAIVIPLILLGVVIYIGLTFKR